jgi:ribonuclease VapC
MIVDSSALVAILRGESERSSFVETILAASSAHISAANYLETALVVDRLGDPVLSRRFDELIDQLGIEIADVTAVQAQIGREAYRDFGRGSAHPAQLNFGDCFAYALARDRGRPLLFKGDDFVHTDIRPAV